MSKKKIEEQENLENQHKEENRFLKRKTLKEIIAPSGIDASNIDHLEIISNAKRYARSFFVSSLPRMAVFPEIFRDLYMFGDINTSIYINPVKEERSQNELNRSINELETERIVAADRGNINRESTLSQKRLEAEVRNMINAADYPDGHPFLDFPNTPESMPVTMLVFILYFTKNKEMTVDFVKKCNGKEKGVY